MPEHLSSTSIQILIVVGAHPKAERDDRPIAYQLARTISDMVSSSGEMAPLKPLVLTDLWYLNDQSLKGQPVICIGAPGVNAFTAYLGSKLPSVFVIDDRLMVQLDLDYEELIACCWGVDLETTQAAVQTFITKYLDGFLKASVRSIAV